MKYILLTIVVLCVQAILGHGSINYCGAKMCAHTNEHTFCRFPPGPNPACVGYIDAKLNFEEKARVLSRLNGRRSDVASGVRDWPAAGDMLKLRWVEELAREAQRWADQCQPPSNPEYYDACRDLYSITVGQCVASVVGEAPGLRSEIMVDMWYAQSMLYKGNITSYILPENTNSFYGDFAQMIWSRAFMVGCGRSRFMTSWGGRLRSVERLVCNFAPRGPPLQRPLWSPAASPAIACPPRSRPDNIHPALCTCHSNMDETYDEDNTMTVEEHLLLNTIMEIERNDSLNYIGSIDEFYLTKLAVATMENPSLTLPSFNSLQKRDIIENLDIDIETTQAVNKTHSDLDNNAITESNLKLIVNNKVVKKKVSVVGRPKTYDIDDLNNSENLKTNSERVIETTTRESDVYDDYGFVDVSEETTSLTSVTMKNTLTSDSGTSRDDVHYNITNNESLETVSSIYHSSDATFSMSTEAFETFLNYIVSNLTIPQILNESAIDANVLDDYLSDPETVRQLQDVLGRMERNLAESSTSGKVRRELRNQNVEAMPGNDGHPRHNELKVKKLEDLSGIERNKSIDRGPMLNMVLKYMPYLRTYEKSIIGDTSASGGCIISPSFILFTVLYF